MLAEIVADELGRNNSSSLNLLSPPPWSDEFGSEKEKWSASDADASQNANDVEYCQ